MADKTKTKSSERIRFLRRREKETTLRRKGFQSLKGWFGRVRFAWMVLPVLSLIMALFLFPNIFSRPKIYNLGDVAEKDIKASREFLLEDKTLTEKNREKALKEVLSIYDYDRSASNLISRLKEAFKAGREYATRQERNSSQEALEDLTFIKEEFFGILEIPYDEKVFAGLLKSGFSAEIEEAVIGLITPVIEKGTVGNKALLMTQIEKGGVVLHDITENKEMTFQDFSRVLDLEGAKRSMDNQSRRLKEMMGVPRIAEVAGELAKLLIKPNLTFNQRETEKRKELARTRIKPAYYKIKQGEMIVREGERIGPEHLLKLSEEMSGRHGVASLSHVPGMTVLIGFLFFTIYLVLLKGIKSFKGERRDLTFNIVILLGMFIFAWAFNFVAEEMARGFPFLTSRTLLFGMPIALGAMLISIFQGLTLAACFSLVISVLTSFVMGGRTEFFVYFLINSLVAAYGVRHCTERGILIKTGLKVGLISGILCLSIQMIYGALYSSESIFAAASGFAGALLATIIATGLLPLIEMSFGFTTDIKLLELANLDQPLLRELMVQSPGTYHHSVIISNMVEATAKAVQANPLLAKVSAYYHDIGKIRKPLYFIENQFDGLNRHEKLAPSMSSLILISHVKDGIELAKKHKLGKEICDIIQQHHGTSLIAYFYQKAKERMEKKGDHYTEVKDENFRYPGPKPQTKEAGLVMLADMVEAASRSLKDPTPSRIKGMVQTIINKAFSDSQLDECELTLKDLHEIAKSFILTLSGIFHQRIEYPEIITSVPKKIGNGDADQVSSEDSRAKKPGDKTKGDEGLKRLGLS